MLIQHTGRGRVKFTTSWRKIAVLTYENVSSFYGNSCRPSTTRSYRIWASSRAPCAISR